MKVLKLDKQNLKHKIIKIVLTNYFDTVIYI